MENISNLHTAKELEELLGKKYEEGKKQLDLTKAFYLGERKTKEVSTALFLE